jgi:hypothetical protein
VSRKNLFKVSLLFFISALGFAAGYLSADPSLQQAELSSQSPAASLNSFAALPCPGESEYQNLAARIHLRIPEGTAACDASYRAKLGQALLLMNRLKMKASPGWLPEVQNDFGDLMGYLAKNAMQVELDLTKSEAIASNVPSEQKIYIGGYFFGMDPLSAISTLIHEARHSVKGAAGHVLCQGGDIPRSDGGCDQRFDIHGATAGAYSYEVLWTASLALYGVNIPAIDREFLMSSALTVLASRFQELPATLAKKTDVIIALNKRGELLMAEPRSHQLTPIPLKLPDGEKITRIEFSFRNSGVLIFTNLKHLYSWTPRHGLQFYNPAVIPENLPVRDASRITLPGVSNRTTFTILTDSNQLLVAKLLKGKSRLELVPFLSAAEMKPAPEFAKYFLAGFGGSYFLSKRGDLYFLNHQIAAEDVFPRPEGLQDPQGWIQGTGGVVYEDLILLNKSGELKTGNASFKEIDDERSVTTYSLTPKEFPIPGRAIKYFQGLKYEALLNDRSQIFFRAYDDHKLQMLEAPDLVDFTIMHKPVLFPNGI